ncbi:MAG: protein kinase [Glaciecola sp.]|jgi:protein phosphatase
MTSNDVDNSEAMNESTIELGFVSIAGKKAVNEDAVNAHVPDSSYAMRNKGVCLIIADGVSSAEAGKMASEYSVSTFVEEYYRTPDTWSVKQSGQKTLSTINLNLFKKSHEFAQTEKGYLCTFTGVVVKSRTAHFFHAGDSRLYLLRKGELKQLTRDHAVNIGGGKNILARAVGMDNVLQIDYGKVALEEGDQLFLSTDGIHDFLDHQQLLDKLSNTLYSCQVIAEAIVHDAQLAESDDNISCISARVHSLPKESRDDYNAKLIRLPFPPHLTKGMILDGLTIEKELFASSRSQVYLVTDIETQQKMVMKTPSFNFQDDFHYIDRFIQEEWIGKRIDSPYVVKIKSLQRDRSCLYYLMEVVEGKSLDKWMLENPLPSPKKAIGIVKQIAKALDAFHQTETIHQDLKPANIMIDDKMNIKVIDFGSVFVAGIAEIFVPLEHLGALGTATYSDPHYLYGNNTGVQGDIYSLATITYELFAGELPYGEKIEQCVNVHDFDKLRYVNASTHNPVIPLWFDRAIEKGVSLDLSKRYRRLPDFIEDVTQPNPIFLQDDPAVNNSIGLLFWQLMSAFWIAMLVLVVILFSTSG